MSGGRAYSLGYGGEAPEPDDREPSDTPRTDAVWAAGAGRGDHKQWETIADMRKHAEALEREGAALRVALLGMLECLQGCEVFIHSRQKINQQEGPGWIKDFTDRAHRALRDSPAQNYLREKP